MEKFVVSSGIKHFKIYDEYENDTGRSVDFNPADNGFAEDLYGLVSKITAIHKEADGKREAVEPAEKFDINRAEDHEMRDAVDALFGEGFSKDVFKTRLFAMSDGLTVVENFLFDLLDEMDESVTANMAKRDERVKKYTDKYSKYKSKYHN